MEIYYRTEISKDIAIESTLVYLSHQTLNLKQSQRTYQVSHSLQPDVVLSTVILIGGYLCFLGRANFHDRGVHDVKLVKGPTAKVVLWFNSTLLASWVCSIILATAEEFQHGAYGRVGRSTRCGCDRPRKCAYCDILHFMGLQFCYLLRLVVNGSGVQVTGFIETR